MKQRIDLCLESGIGSAGLSASELGLEIDRTQPVLDRLKTAYKDQSLPHLALPHRTDDLADITAQAERIAAGSRDVVICGTGGSSLGGQTLAQVAGWHTPNGAEYGPDPGRPRLHFLDNVDGAAMARLCDRLDLAQTHILMISKSGGTAETLAQGIAFLDTYRDAGFEGRIPDHFTALTEPGEKRNGLRDLSTHFDIPIIDHLPDLGGRFSALSNVGLIPAAIAGLDIAAIRGGARQVLVDTLDADPANSLPVSGAALAVAFLKQRGIAINVMLGYGDGFERLTRWHAQLWAESLGKAGKGMTPLPVLGPVDQHSQLQLFLDGPADKLFTVLVTETGGEGTAVSSELANLAGADYLADRRMGDLVDSMQRATVETLARNGRPVRTLHIDSLDEAAIGGLMMHFMLETMVAADLLAVDAFDQPAVEEGKVLARRYLAEFMT